MSGQELQNLRQRLLTQGAERLSDFELLSVIYNSTKFAWSLTNSSEKWWELGQHDLRKIPNFTPTRVAQILSLVELSRRIRVVPLSQGEILRCSEQVAAAYGPRLAGHQQEVFFALSLDNRHRIIAEHEVARGTMSNVVVDPRVIFRKMLRDGAAAVIAVHNHPSGDPTPSSDDLNMCQRLSEAGRLLGLKLLDFIIVGAEGSVSFADCGLM